MHAVLLSVEYVYAKQKMGDNHREHADDMSDIAHADANHGIYMNLAAGEC